MKTFTIKNDYITVCIASHGAEIRSVTDNNSGTEYMWSGDPDYWARVSPVLFPIVGGLKDKKCLIDGSTYSMGQHGFARDMDFEMMTQNESDITFLLSSNNESLKMYPYNFELLISYKLTDNRVSVNWTIKNTNDKRMCFNIGAHPAFLCPILPNTSQDDYFIKFDAENIYYSHINKEGLYIPDKYNLPLVNDSYKIKATTFDDDALIVEGEQAHNVSLCKPDGTPYINVSFDAPLFGLWSPAKKGAPFVCIEPWYGRCDSAEFKGDFTQRDYSNFIEPGEKFDASYSIKFM